MVRLEVTTKSLAAQQEPEKSERGLWPMAAGPLCPGSTPHVANVQQSSRIA